jgi:hypothetical protein
MDPSPPPRPDLSPAESLAPQAAAGRSQAARAAIAVVALAVVVLVFSAREGEAPAPVAAAGWVARDLDAASTAPRTAAVATEPGFGRPAVDSPRARAAQNEDVCSAGADLGDPEAFARRVAAASRTARERLLALLGSSADDRLRILGLYLQRDADVAAAALPAAIMGESCGRDAACARQAAEALAEVSRKAAGPRSETIARIASASREPVAYALAVEACAGNMTSVAASCRLISAEQWARLDVDNAVPWLHAAAAASARRDPAAVADALHHVAHSRSNRLYGDSVVDLLHAALPNDLGQVERAQVLASLASAVTATWTLPDYAPVLEFCDAKAVRDSNRAQSCDALAAQLTDRASTMIDLDVGIRLARQIDWPEARIEALRRRQDAYARVQVEMLAEAEARSCRELVEAGERIARLARLGEIGALQEAVEQSGKSIDALAAEERATRPVRVAAGATN